MLLLDSRLLRRFSLILACVCAFAPAAWAQANVQAGARVRVLTSTADTMMYGTLVTLDSASLLLAPAPDADAESVRVPLAGVERLEVSRGGKPSTLLGAAAGAVVGTGTGLGIRLLSTRGDCDFVCGACRWEAR